ncbi:MAG: hypothetical protein M0Z36_00225 [Thermaerobacter sp.]|nr:hypothetical protein [Thermaerobacter sp.]
MALDKSFTVSFPSDLAEAIERLVAEPEEFVIEAVRHEIHRRDQLAAIREAAGEDHDEIPDTVEEQWNLCAVFEQTKSGSRNGRHGCPDLGTTRQNRRGRLAGESGGR